MLATIPRPMFALLLACIAAAQEAPRKPIVGMVRGTDGPIAGATVTFVGFDAAFDPVFDTADVVEVAADDGGVFQALVRRGLPYVGFATADAGNGRARRSAVLGWFGAGARVEFECAAADGPFAIAVRGLEAWNAIGPVAWRARPALSGRLLPMARALSANGEAVAVWPALPLGGWDLELANGVPLLTRSAAPVANAQFAVAPPQAIPCRAIDAAGAPVAGAEVWLRGDAFVDDAVDGLQTLRVRRRARVATTDRGGRAVVQLPVPDPFARGQAVDAMFTVVAPGRAERLAGFQGLSTYANDALVDRVGIAAARELTFTLPELPPVATVVGFAGAPLAAGAEARLQVIAKMNGGNRSFLHDARCYRATVGDAGALAFAGVPADPYAMRPVLLDAQGGAPLLLPPIAGRNLGNKLDVAGAAMLRLSLLDARRGPAGGQVFYLRQEGDPNAPAMTTLLRWCVDGAGRAELRLWAGSWFLYAADDASAAWRRFEVRAGEVLALEAAMTEYPLLRGTLRGDRSEPIAAAAVELRNIAVEALKDEEAALARSFLRLQWERRLGAVRTDSDGAFAIPCPPVDGMHVTVQLASAGRRSDRFELKPQSDELVLRLQ